MECTTKVELIKFKGENVYIDLNDILDIIPYEGKLIETGNKQSYILVFQTGETWYGVTMRKTVFTKFEKLKEKRGQK